MPRERGQKLIANNKRARYDYFIDDVYEAGIVLSGTEVKALRQGKASINDAYATVDAGELWLENAYIPEFTQGSWTNHAPRRRRKLLLAKKEIARLAGKTKEVGFTLVPISLYFKDGYAKIEIGLARGKKDYDKRETLKEKDAKREINKAIREQKTREN
ncbi:MAG: SsrA-binding protein SmpB [Aquiluna sp.]|jgi:SsrA-binding protein|nr:SsrA-binding protein SmpB [Actinomycetota bacterium]NCW23229.1 SsrA-binding protein SmpB [Actinomycetota bacterium]NCW95114.1 SsrA-binding protein SmpB [Actinomycetota bacterium]